ncbi:unnamed protein product [Amoebophrya sp. A25]|nr:unnamed protein product [Amoebophrya sp. A25]|eukprot:GSA25T00021469001.1
MMNANAISIQQHGGISSSTLNNNSAANNGSSSASTYFISAWLRIFWKSLDKQAFAQLVQDNVAALQDLIRQPDEWRLFLLYTIVNADLSSCLRTSGTASNASIGIGRATDAPPASGNYTLSGTTSSAGTTGTPTSTRLLDHASMNPKVPGRSGHRRKSALESTSCSRRGQNAEHVGSTTTSFSSSRNPSCTTRNSSSPANDASTTTSSNTPHQRDKLHHDQQDPDQAAYAVRRLLTDADVLFSQSVEFRSVQTRIFYKEVLENAHLSDLGPRYTREILDSWGCGLADYERNEMLGVENPSGTTTQEHRQPFRTSGMLRYDLKIGDNSDSLSLSGSMPLQSGSSSGTSTSSSSSTAQKASGGRGTTHEMSHLQRGRDLPFLRIGPWIYSHRRDRDVEYQGLSKVEGLLNFALQQSRRKSTAGSGEQAAASPGNNTKENVTGGSTSRASSPTAEMCAFNPRNGNANGHAHAPQHLPVTGFVKLALNRTPCLSCLGAIANFRLRYRGIQLQIGFDETEKRF